MSRQTRHHRHITPLLPELRQIAHAVGRIGQAMEEHHAAARLAQRQQHKRTVPVLLKLPRPDPAVTIKAVDRGFIFLRQSLCHLTLEIGENRLLPRQILGKGRLVDLFGRHLVATPGMPAMQGRAALGLIDPPGEKDHQQRQYRNAPFFQQ